MKTKSKPKFTVYDHPTRYTVPSAKKGQVHLVDLAANDMLGECSCEHFQCVVLPRWRQASELERQWKWEYRCKHLTILREEIGTIFVAALNATTEISPTQK
jgi:hypothetical protein